MRCYLLMASSPCRPFVPFFPYPRNLKFIFVPDISFLLLLFIFTTINLQITEKKVNFFFRSKNKREFLAPCKLIVNLCLKKKIYIFSHFFFYIEKIYINFSSCFVSLISYFNLKIFLSLHR